MRSGHFAIAWVGVGSPMDGSGAGEEEDDAGAVSFETFQVAVQEFSATPQTIVDARPYLVDEFLRTAGGFAVSRLPCRG